MKSVSITTGNFATSEGNKGNFTAYSKGQQVFIHKSMLASIGITTNDEFQKAKPIYALIDEKTFNPVDENGNALEPFTRLQAMAIYKTEDEMIEAELADDKLEIRTMIKRAQLREEIVKSAELTEESVKAILSASSLFK
jgi:hypothetical protein